mgnify:CR=1 FL=1|tara:strand:+ start:82 stop:717 length:636 start_codon:yes stop_codon:yes gene_type:complete
MRNKLIGGVTPLKRRTSRSKAGTVGKKATATRAQDRSGYSRSGAEGVNTPSFTPNTRVTSSLVETLKETPKAAATGKSSKSGATLIGYDAGGGPIYNYYYGDVDQRVDKSIHQNQNINVAGGGGAVITKKKSHGNFAEACLNPDGSRKPSGSIGTDSAGNTFICEWGKVNKKSNQNLNTNVNTNATQIFAPMNATQDGNIVNLSNQKIKQN